MRVPLSWLKEFVELSVAPQVLAERLTMAGLEVEAIEEVAGDTVLVLGVTPNRPDWLGLKGVAREVAAAKAGRIHLPVIKAPKGSGAIREGVRVRVVDRRQCPRYVARMIDGVRVGPSPAPVQARLEAAGIRAINNVVDATNYVMLELGQPLHAFDWRALRGQAIVVRRAESAQRFTTLDGVERQLTADDLLICDAGGPVALAGIMGGANSEIRSDTTRIVLESAYFLPNGIRRTSRRLGLSSESSRRFERGVDPNQVDAALHRVAALIVAWAGGQPTADWIDVYPTKILPRKIAIAPADVTAALGAACPPTEMKAILAKLGCTVRTGKRWTVQPPTSRPDLCESIDLCEEIARCWGYDRIPVSQPRAPMAPVERPRGESTTATVRSGLIANGFTESLHYSFCSQALAAQFDVGAPMVPIKNPLGQEPTVLVSSLAPGLVEAVQLNCRAGLPRGRLFQIGRVFSLTSAGTVQEEGRIGGTLFGTRKSMSWTSAQDMIDFYDVKGAVAGLLQSIGLEESRVEVGGLPAFMHPGASCRSMIGEQSIGFYGLLSPETTTRCGFEVPVGYFELDIDRLIELADARHVTYRGIPRFPGIRRDVALLVDDGVAAGAVAAAIRTGAKRWLTQVTLFDLYRGEKLPAGKKSVAYAIYYQDPERTLTDEEVNVVHHEVLNALQGTIGAEIRS